MSFSADFKKASGFGNDVDILMLSIDDIVVKEQVRKSFNEESIISLANNILARNKLFNPLVVRREGDSFVLNQGERRLRALRYLVAQGHDAFQTVACRVEKFTDDSEIFLSQFSENIAREDLNPFEILDAICFYNKHFDKKHGWKIRFANANGLSGEFISRHYALLKVSDRVKQLCLDGLVTSPRTLVQISELPVCDAVCDAIENGSTLQDAFLLVRDDSTEINDTKGVNDFESDKDDVEQSSPPVVPQFQSSEEFPMLSDEEITALVFYLMKQESLNDFDDLRSFIAGLSVDRGQSH